MKKLPQIIEANTFPVTLTLNDVGMADFKKWYKQHEQEFKAALAVKGAIHIKGLGIDSVSTFEDMLTVFSHPLLDYVDGNSPRKKLSSKVYTSTEYDSSKSITLHNELSYSCTYPKHIYFSCVQPAMSGGETPIADGRVVLAKMDQSLVKKIEKHGVKYIRNLHGGDGLGPSWQETFETTDRQVVNAFCKSNQIDATWTENGLNLVHLRQGVINHPKTNETVWFNQIDQFHPSHLGKEYYETLMMLYQQEELLPMYVKFGDDSRISDEMVSEIRGVIDEHEVASPWEKGDALILDNILVSHGRRPFQGPRSVLVAMS
ncbi:MAG: hypothetical protein DI538_18810 [Azospira oryzae]|nr:MAG: hypothetical protein DI538_18810 [Azospira oryzae]